MVRGVDEKPGISQHRRRSVHLLSGGCQHPGYCKLNTCPSPCPLARPTKVATKE